MILYNPGVLKSTYKAITRCSVKTRLAIVRGYGWKAGYVELTFSHLKESTNRSAGKLFLYVRQSLDFLPAEAIEAGHHMSSYPPTFTIKSGDTII